MLPKWNRLRSSIYQIAIKLCVQIFTIRNISDCREIIKKHMKLKAQTINQSVIINTAFGPAIKILHSLAKGNINKFNKKSMNINRKPNKKHTHTPHTNQQSKWSSFGDLHSIFVLMSRWSFSSSTTKKKNRLWFKFHRIVFDF